MPRRLTHRLILRPVGCVLALAASGHDLNVLRLALPAAFAEAPVGGTPLDDEKADFLQTEGATTAWTRHGHPRAHPGPVAAGSANRVAGTRLPAAGRFVTARHRPLPAAFRVPLRC